MKVASGRDKSVGTTSIVLRTVVPLKALVTRTQMLSSAFWACEAAPIKMCGKKRSTDRPASKKQTQKQFAMGYVPDWELGGNRFRALEMDWKCEYE